MIIDNIEYHEHILYQGRRTNPRINHYRFKFMDWIKSDDWLRDHVKQPKYIEKVTNYICSGYLTERDWTYYQLKYNHLT